jgi:hypothetical protein
MINTQSILDFEKIQNWHLLQHQKLETHWLKLPQRYSLWELVLVLVASSNVKFRMGSHVIY